MNKYRENETLKIVQEYVDKTYQGHYVGDDQDKTQTLDLLESIGTVSDFCQSNIIKYAARFGKKNGKNKSDLLKVIHYAILLYHFSNFDNDRWIYENFWWTTRSIQYL